MTTRHPAIARQSAAGRFHEIYISADIETCEKRDTKGLYKRARSGEIRDFTGISAPYEPPESLDQLVAYVDSAVGIALKI